MGVKTVTVILDDLDGQELEANAKPVRVSIDRKSWDLYLSDKNREKFLADLNKYTSHAQPVSGSAASRTKPAGSDAAAIREWALENGHTVPDRGRIPKAVREAYDANN